AISDIEAYRLDKAGFEHIIRARPELAEGISTILNRRLSRFDDLERGHANDKPDTESPRSSEVAVLRKKIRDFFGL
ncbi:MAG: hypothetical protein L6Q69_14425, partial [Zoogloea sp.]|nr:hypothetical protein [Zoogloea sp.]